MADVPRALLAVPELLVELPDGDHGVLLISLSGIETITRSLTARAIRIGPDGRAVDPGVVQDRHMLGLVPTQDDHAGWRGVGGVRHGVLLVNGGRHASNVLHHLCQQCLDITR